MINPSYINADGFVTIQPNAPAIPGEGNGWLQTGLCAALGQYPNSKESIILMFIRCMADVGYPPLSRSPHKKNLGDENKADDYWGVFVLAKLHFQDWAKNLLRWCEANGWTTNNLDPKSTDYNYRFDRFPGFVPCLRLAAGQQLPVMDSIALAGSLIYDIFSAKEDDGNMRSYCKAFVAKSDWICAIPAAIILWRKASWAKYFGEGHPLN